MVHIGVMIYFHERIGQIAGNPAAPAAYDHIEPLENAVGIHEAMDGGAVGTLGVTVVKSRISARSASVI